MATTSRPAPAAEQERSAARLYETYGRQLYRFCLARLRSREEAEDAVQSTFLRAHAALQKGIVPRFEAAWLYKIAHNVCTTRREMLGRRALVETLPGAEELERAPGPDGPSRDDLRALAEAVSELPESQRQAILLREWKGLTYVEIADELGLSVSAVETLIFRARRRLVGELELRGARPGRVLDLASALAALRGLLARLGEAVPAKVAAGAALVAVGGAGIGVGVAVSDPRPDRAPATSSVPAALRSHALPTAASTPAATPARATPVSAPPRRATSTTAPLPAAAPPAATTFTDRIAVPPTATAPAPARHAETKPAAATTQQPTAPPLPAADPSLPDPSLPSVSTPALPLPLPTPSVPTAVDTAALDSVVDAPTVPASLPEPPQLSVVTATAPLP